MISHRKDSSYSDSTEQPTKLFFTRWQETLRHQRHSYRETFFRPQIILGGLCASQLDRRLGLLIQGLLTKMFLPVFSR